MSGMNKIKGAIYGVAVGDAMGAPWEGWRPKNIQEKFGTVKDLMSFDAAWSLGEFTDDTWLTLATAQAYNGPTFMPEKAGLAMVIWMRNIGKGIGRLTNFALSNLSSGRCDIYNSGHKALASVSRGDSNGSLMKCISTGLVNSQSEIDGIVKESAIISEITHASPKCVASCIGYNIVVSGLMEDKDYLTTLRLAQDFVTPIDVETAGIFQDVANGKPMRFDPNIMKGTGYVLRALDRALIAGRDAISFEDEMIKVINEGGDTDTNSAIAGGILGVKFGYDAIPQRWIKPLLNKDELDECIGVISRYRGICNH